MQHRAAVSRSTLWNTLNSGSQAGVSTVFRHMRQQNQSSETSPLLVEHHSSVDECLGYKIFAEARFRKTIEFLREKFIDSLEHVNLPSNIESSWSNSAKCWFEDLTTTWDWWPFVPPIRSPRCGEARIEWRCVSDSILNPASYIDQSTSKVEESIVRTFLAS